MEAFVNYTPHDIIVETGSTIHKITSSGVARVEESSEVVCSHADIEIRRIKFGEIVGLPDEQPGVKVIVSMVVLEAAKLVSDRQDLVRPDSGKTARRVNGQIVAVTGFTV